MSDIETEVARLRACREHQWTTCVEHARLPAPQLPILPPGKDSIEVWCAKLTKDQKSLVVEPGLFHKHQWFSIFLYTKPGWDGVVAWTYRYVEPTPRVPALQQVVPEAEEPKWVSCSVRSPQEGQAVWLTFYGISQAGVWRQGAFYADTSSQQPIPNVTDWMPRLVAPLPAPMSGP